MLISHRKLVIGRRGARAAYRVGRSRRSPIATVTAVVLVSCLTAIGTIDLVTTEAGAAGVRAGVEIESGEFALLRGVPKRTAYRHAEDAPALLIDPGPDSEIKRALSSSGVVEITDFDADRITVGADRPDTASALPSDSGYSELRGIGVGSVLPIDTTRNGVVGNVGGAVRAVTSGIGQRVTDSVGIVNSILGGR